MKSEKLRKTLIILFWLCLWQCVAMIVNQKVIFPGPSDVLLSLIERLSSRDFAIAVLCSMGRILLGLAAGMAVGCMFAMASYKAKLLGEFLSPVVTLIKAAPVASYAVLFLIWWNSAMLTFAVSLFVAFPIMYVNTLEGLNAVPDKYHKFDRIYRLSLRDKFMYIYRPSLSPFVLGAVRIACPMSFKAGIASEVIGTPLRSLGSDMYLSKVYFDTAGLFATTFTLIVLAYVWEKITIAVMTFLLTNSVRIKGTGVNGGERKTTMKSDVPTLRLKEINKSYGDKQVLRDITFILRRGDDMRIDWPSGEGKSTLLGIIAGIIRPDSGAVIKDGISRLSFMFQEDVLIENLSPLQNVMLVTNDYTLAKARLLKLLPEDRLDTKVCNLSGGERRRVSFALAISVGAELILLDEPFAGLDKEAIRIVEEIIAEVGTESIVIIASHV